MARVPIEQTEGFGLFYQPVGYFQDGDFEVSPALLPDDPNILRPFAGGSIWATGENWCTVLIKATVSSDEHPEPEELSFVWGFYFVRTRMAGLESPFSHIYFFESGQSYQFNSTTGNYNFVCPTMKVLGHRIPFKMLYKVATGSLEDSEISIGAEQSQQFSRGAGWEHDITSPEPGPGTYSYLTDVRLAPV